MALELWMWQWWVRGVVNMAVVLVVCSDVWAVVVDLVVDVVGVWW